MGIFIDDFVSMANWNAQDVSINPAGAAYHYGNGQATGQAYRVMAAGDVYIETDVYFDNPSQWAMIKMQSPVSNMYNQLGAGVLISDNGSITSFLQNGAGGQISPGVRAPMSAATSIRVGLHCRASALAYDFYLEGAKVGTQTVSALPTGTWIEFGAYFGAGGHFKYFAVADRVLTAYDARVTPSAVSY